MVMYITFKNRYPFGIAVTCTFDGPVRLSFLRPCWTLFVCSPRNSVRCIVWYSRRTWSKSYTVIAGEPMAFNIRACTKLKFVPNTVRKLKKKHSIPRLFWLSGPIPQNINPSCAWTITITRKQLLTLSCHFVFKRDAEVHICKYKKINSYLHCCTQNKMIKSGL